MHDDNHDPDEQFDRQADTFVEALLVCVGCAAVFGIILLLIVVV